MTVKSIQGTGNKINMQDNESLIKVKKNKIIRRFSGKNCMSQQVYLCPFQHSSFQDFLQMDTDIKNRKNIGLHRVLKEVLPVVSYNGLVELTYEGYRLDPIKYSIAECKKGNLTYAVPVVLRLKRTLWEMDANKESRKVIDICEQDVHLGAIPMMTDQGSFIINGVERVLVSQLHRAPGAFFELTDDKTQGKSIYSSLLIPSRGSWLDMMFDAKNIVHARIDKKRKVLATTILMCFNSSATDHDYKFKDSDKNLLARGGMSRAEVLSVFYGRNKVEKVDAGWSVEWIETEWLNVRLKHDLVSLDGKVLAEAGVTLKSRMIERITQSGVKNILLTDEQFAGSFAACDIVHTTTGKIYVHAGEELDIKTALELSQTVDHFYVISTNRSYNELYWLDTLNAEKSHTREEALQAIYKVVRPNERPSLNTAWELFYGMFLDSDRYDLSDVGRVRLNIRLGLKVDTDVTVLTKEDIVAMTRMLLDIKAGKADVDNTDSLSSRRVRLAGELLEAQCYTALAKMTKLIKDRMSATDAVNTTPHALFNSQLFVSAMKDFFAKSQLSQFMDHTNPLSALTHVRRLSALGPGGLNKDRADASVRDVQSTYNGRICIVQTPEGTNIGLINAFTVNANIDKYGFLQACYKKVVDGVVTDETVYLSALDEARNHIAYADCLLDDNGKIVDKMVTCRKGTETVIVPVKDIEYIDASTNQIVSVAASLIPWLESNDATRDLMGANMQGQAVPGLFPQAPLVGTGMEQHVLPHTNACIYAKRSGEVIQVSGDRIVVKADEYDTEGGVLDVYRLQKFEQSNAGTCINQVSAVDVGDRIEQGDILTNGSASQHGELALGYNVRAAFVSLEGRNFEDSIVLSQKLVQEDVFTSIHLRTFEAVVKDTRHGQQQTTSDIPGIYREKVWHLDESGIIQIGTEVHPGMILVGRVTPVVENQVSGEEKLIKSICKGSTTSVRDDSLYTPAGVTGTVTEVKVIHRRDNTDKRAAAVKRLEIAELKKDRDLEIDMLKQSFSKVISQLYEGQKFDGDITADKITIDNCSKFKHKTAATQKRVDFIVKEFEKAVVDIKQKCEQDIEKVYEGIELPNGVEKIVKVTVAVKCKMQEGDKLAGRHGNKGIVSYIMPIEDMPYTADGKPVDIVLSPLGVVSRMNLGQIFESHLGKASVGLADKLHQMLCGYNADKKAQESLKQAADIDVSNIDINNPEESFAQLSELQTQEKIIPSTVSDIRTFLKEIYIKESEYIDRLNDEELIKWSVQLAKEGIHFACPVFNSAREDEVQALLEKAGFDKTGKETLYDGKTGVAFEHKVNVGVLYMLKLHHLVNKKVHARSIGPYSSVTLQPLGGKAQDGGQRDGEMENWALQAYGAAYMLLEMMTIKSDDVSGRIAAFESITQDRMISHVSVPVAFQVFMKELEALCIKVSLGQRKNMIRDGWTRRQDIDTLALSLASPEDILANSYGEPEKPETVNYRNYKPEKHGLCCERIFGPVKNYECSCGKYKKYQNRGIICERCGVEVTDSWVRRERMGHIKLVTPVLHTWFYRVLPSRVALMLNYGAQDIDAIINFERYVVVDPGMTVFSKGQLLTEDEYQSACDAEGAEMFQVSIGVEAIEILLKDLNLEAEIKKVKEELELTGTKPKRKKLIMRFKLLNGFYENKIKPEWMVIRVLPVLPADLRPIVSIEAGRLAASDITELYRRFIIRHNRLKHLIDLSAPEILIRNAKRALQEALDNLFDNTRRERPVLGSNNRPLKSISDKIKGKDGMIRQNLVGKRVDYSGRSVITVDPELRLHQCGLPKGMALELFKPFVCAALIKNGVVLTLRDANMMIEEERPEVWDVLESVVYRHPVLLNRAPSLHRLSIRAFEVVLVHGNAIRLHPLVCAGFNADFDGDQMAVHVPLSVEAQLEARVSMLASNNILHPADGKIAILPSKDMVLGVYHLTLMKQEQDQPKRFASLEEALTAHEYGKMHYQDHIQVWLNGQWVNTTAGRIIFYGIMPKEGITFDMINQVMRNKDIAKLFKEMYDTCGQEQTGIAADKIMALGFKYATKSGITFALSDLKIPEIKQQLIDEVNKKVDALQDQYMEGLISNNERYNAVQDLWMQAIDDLSEHVKEGMTAGGQNDIYTMIDSGARGTKNQLMHMIGMRGLVVTTTGKVLEHLVQECYKEGLAVRSFFDTTHGARKGVADTALRTAVAGYLTRRLVDVAQDCVVLDEDCGTTDGIVKKSIYQGDTVVEMLSTRIVGRVLAQDIKDADGNVLIEAGILISKKHFAILEQNKIESATVRSTLTCAAKNGVCAKCYGLDLGRNKMVSFGTAVGVIAAQSISEPSTQLTLRTFHQGGGAHKDVEESTLISPVNGVIKYNTSHTVVNRNGESVVIRKSTDCVITSDKGKESVYTLPYGAKIFFKSDSTIMEDDLIAEWDAYSTPIIAESTGVAQYIDMIDDITVKKSDSEAGIMTVIDWKQTTTQKDFRPAIQLMQDNGQPIITEYGAELKYYLYIGSMILAKEGEKILPGDVIAKISKTQSKSQDITGGLPMISDLFEAREPANKAILADISGTVRFIKDRRNVRRIAIQGADEQTMEYSIPSHAHLLVHEGYTVTKGELLTDGRVYAFDVLRILGTKPMVEFFINELQNIYRSNSISVNEKHIEVIVKHMLQAVEITEPGDSTYLTGERIHSEELDIVNAELISKGEKIAYSIPHLQGISDRSLIKSGLSSAAFQDSIKYMLSAIYSGFTDDLTSHVKTAMMTANLANLGTGAYIYKMHNQYYSNAENIPSATEEVDSILEEI